MTTPKTTVARLRWHRGLTQAELATLAKISVKTVEKIEAGQSKGSPRTALLLAGALAVDVELIVRALVEDYHKMEDFRRKERDKALLTSVISGAREEEDGGVTSAATAEA